MKYILLTFIFTTTLIHAEMKAFENRKRSIQTENSIIVSDQPVK